MPELPHSTRVPSDSGSSTAAPSQGPSSVPTPPRMVTSTTCTDMVRLNMDSGSMKPTYMAKKPPQTPVMPAEITKASIL